VSSERRDAAASLLSLNEEDSDSAASRTGDGEPPPRALRTRPTELSRRELLFGISFPFFRPKYVELAGARFRIVRYGRSKRRYVVIHGNEETARQVLTAHMIAHPGIAHIVESRTRNVAIEGGQIDPNRMFSRVGAEANLRRLNPDWEGERMGKALALLDRGREALVKALFPPSGGLTIALHNNSQGYSVRDEQPISDGESIREPRNPRAFFLCTDEADFQILSTSPYNVVLQKKAPKEDDGSLSRLAAARGVRYVNLETALGQSGRQKEMLDWLERCLP
jgi:hypothetical protein